MMPEKPAPEDCTILAWKIFWSINPALEQYPSYSPFLSIEDYYSIENNYPADIVPHLEKLHENHKNKFSTTLAELKNVFATTLRQRFFSPEPCWEVGEAFPCYKPI